MKKSVKICYILSIGFATAFVLKNVLDYLVYSNTLNSATFWVWILINAVWFLVPAAILALTGLLLNIRK